MEYKVFRYRGRKFYITKGELESVEGVKVDMKGFTIVVLNENLTERKMNRILHRIVTGKKIRIIKFGERMEIYSDKNTCFI